MTEPDVEPVDADPRWQVEEDHPLFGQEVTVEVGDREVTGRVGPVELFRGRRRARSRPRSRLRADRQHRSRPTVLNLQTKQPVRGFKSGADERDGNARKVTPHPRLGGRSQEERLDTLLFSARLDKRYSRELLLSLEIGPRRAVETKPTMTLRRVPTAIPTNSDETIQPPTASEKFFSLNERSLMRVGGAPSPPTGGVAARYLPNRQARPVRSTGGQATGRPPASQHDAVCGGGCTPHPHSMMLCGRPGGGWS